MEKVCNLEKRNAVLCHDLLATTTKSKVINNAPPNARALQRTELRKREMWMPRGVFAQLRSLISVGPILELLVMMSIRYCKVVLSGHKPTVPI